MIILYMYINFFSVIIGAIFEWYRDEKSASSWNSTLPKSLFSTNFEKSVTRGNTEQLDCRMSNIILLIINAVINSNCYIIYMNCWL